MGRITRCRNCFGPVFRHAAACPQCGEGRTPETRRRLLSKGNWLFILVVLAIFTAGDTVALMKEKGRQRQYEKAEDRAIGFIQDLFTKPTSDLSRHFYGLYNPEPIRKILDTLQGEDAECTMLPADVVDIHSVERRGYTTVRVEKRRFGRRRGYRYEVAHVRTFTVAVNRAGDNWIVELELALMDNTRSGNIAGVELVHFRHTGKTWSPAIHNGSNDPRDG